jgi:hypothetical protein
VVEEDAAVAVVRVRVRQKVGLPAHDADFVKGDAGVVGMKRVPDARLE